jgi:hypothetical protein
MSGMGFPQIPQQSIGFPLQSLRFFVRSLRFLASLRLYVACEYVRRVRPHGVHGVPVRVRRVRVAGQAGRPAQAGAPASLGSDAKISEGAACVA